MQVLAIRELAPARVSFVSARQNLPERLVSYRPHQVVPRVFGVLSSTTRSTPLFRPHGPGFGIRRAPRCRFLSCAYRSTFGELTIGVQDPACSCGINKLHIPGNAAIGRLPHAGLKYFKSGQCPRYVCPGKPTLIGRSCMSQRCPCRARVYD